MLRTVSTALLGLVVFLTSAGLLGSLERPLFQFWSGLPFIDHRSLLAFLIVFSLAPLAEETARLITTIAVLSRSADHRSATATIMVGLGFGLVERSLGWILHQGAPAPDLMWLYDLRAIVGHGGLSAALWLLLRHRRLNPLLALGACTSLHVATNLSTRLTPDGIIGDAVAGFGVMVAYVALMVTAQRAGTKRDETLAG